METYEITCIDLSYIIQADDIITACCEFRKKYPNEQILFAEDKKASRDSRILSDVSNDKNLTLSDLNGKTIFVKFTVKKGETKLYPEDFDLLIE